MRVDKTIVLLISLLALLWGLGADDKGVKIGIVDLDQAVIATDEGKKAREELERKTRAAEAQLQPLYDQFQTMKKDFEAKQLVLSDDAKRAMQLDAAELRNRIEGKQKEVQAQLEVDRERLVGPLRTKLVSVVEKVGREQGFSLIFMRNTPGIMYTREALDITDLIIKSFNEKG